MLRFGKGHGRRRRVTIERMSHSRWQLASPGGLEASVLAYGATLQQVLAPDRSGTRANVALGFDDAADYEAHPGTYLGATVGRYANRIAGGRFTLDGREYRLPRNDRGNHPAHRRALMAPKSQRLSELSRTCIKVYETFTLC